MKCRAASILLCVLAGEKKCENEARKILRGPLQVGIEVCDEHAARLLRALPRYAVESIGEGLPS